MPGVQHSSGAIGAMLRPASGLTAVSCLQRRRLRRLYACSAPLNAHVMSYINRMTHIDMCQLPAALLRPPAVSIVAAQPALGALRRRRRPYALLHALPCLQHASMLTMLCKRECTCLTCSMHAHGRRVCVSRDAAGAAASCDSRAPPAWASMRTLVAWVRCRPRW